MERGRGNASQANRSRLSLLLIMALGVLTAGASLFLTLSNAAGSPGTSVATQSVTLTTGATGQASITVNEVPSAGVGMYQITVSYNKNVVTVSSVSGGNSPYNAAPDATINNTTGSVTIEQNVAPSGPTSGNQVVAKLNLQAVGSASQTTLLTVSVGFLHDNAHNTLAGVTITNGTVTLAAPTPAPAVSFVGLMLMAAGLGLVMLLGTPMVRRRLQTRRGG